MTELDALAADVGTSGRTLRRALGRGTIRGSRPSPRTVVLPVAERTYVREHWSLLHAILGTLRTLPSVRLAVLYGSEARGDAEPESDLDLLVRIRRDTYVARAELRNRLENATDRRVHLVSLEQAEDAPLLLADVLRDGRVLADRDGEWLRLRARATTIARRAREEDERLEREAWALESLMASIS